MKNIFLLLLFYPFFLIGQTPKGVYCTPAGFAGDCIAFKSFNRFKFNSWGCLGGSQGEGKYELTSDSLILKFNTNQKKGINHLKIIDSSSTSKDSVDIKVQLFENKKEPLMFASVILSKTMDSDTTNIIALRVTNFNGEAIFRIPKSNSDLWLSCKYVGTKTTYISLNTSQNYKVIGHLYFNNLSEISNEVYRYKVSKVNKDKIILNSISSWGDSLTTTFIKRKNK